MADNTRKTGGNAPDNHDQERFNLARWIVVFVFSATGILGLAALVLAGYSEHYDHVKDILTLLLPVMGAWAGTVFAFYFSRENFESAARNTAALVKQLTPDEKLRSISIREAAIPIEEAVTLHLDKPENEIKLKDDMIEARLAKEKRERLPVLDAQGRVKYIAHRSLIDRFIADKAMSEPGAVDLCNLTLADMLENPEYKAMLTGFGILRPTATLAEAKMLMDTVPNCSDVFTTEDGTAASKAIGWVTNVIVREKATV